MPETLEAALKQTQSIKDAQKSALAEIASLKERIETLEKQNVKVEGELRRVFPRMAELRLSLNTGDLQPIRNSLEDDVEPNFHWLNTLHLIVEVEQDGSTHPVGIVFDDDGIPFYGSLEHNDDFKEAVKIFCGEIVE